ncbi:hypothetical protein SKAU_G00358140 [Synaphobranchus kaupii]|uniref:Uncharacterized protein n=1 Tax=Synaphobranchus kaupii TaxID=118154 RepID=A0A9Q1IEP3_SYNKA|nr:hypothetical protein SKAU_G00358140 [Synaphobranchus kaupii]
MNTAQGGPPVWLRTGRKAQNAVIYRLAPALPSGSERHRQAERFRALNGSPVLGDGPCAGETVWTPEREFQEERGAPLNPPTPSPIKPCARAAGRRGDNSRRENVSARDGGERVAVGAITAVKR